MTDLSVDARLLATERGEAPRINSAAAIFASALMAAGALALADHYAWRQGALFLLGGALGLVLYHALFGLPRPGVSSSRTDAVPACGRKW
jgi:uncharacterized protein